MVFKKQRISEGIKGCKYAPIQAGKPNQTSSPIAPSKEAIEGKVARDLRGIVRALRILGHPSIDAGSRFEKRRSRTRKAWRTRRVSTGVNARASSRIQVPLHELPIYRPRIVPQVAALAWRTLSEGII
jgi:hypothetical protein